MRKIMLVIVAILSFVLTLAITLAIAANDKPDIEPGQSPENELAKCNTLVLNGDSENKLDLLFFTDEETTKSYIDYIFAISPFKEYSSRFNIHYIEEQADCRLYRNIAVYCYSKEILKRASACPHDIIIAFKEEDEEIRASAYHNVISINTRLPKEVLIHELGHVQPFNFDEEYIANYNPSSSSPNCKKTCSSFNGAECFQECSSSSHQRSVFNGIMRTLSPENPHSPFGAHNANHMINSIEKFTSPKQEKTITAQVSISETSTCKDQEFIILESSYKENKIKVSKKEKFRGCAMSQLTGPLSYEISTHNSEIISKGAFNPLNIYTDKPQLNTQIANLEGETYTNDELFFLAFSPSQNNKEINFYNENQENIGRTTLNDIGARPCIV